jgi:hypothetical protein
MVFELESSVGMACYHSEPFGISGDAALPPHSAHCATLDEGGLVEVRELDAFNDVAVAAQDKSNVVIVQ